MSNVFAGCEASFPWFAGAMLAFESCEVIRLRLTKFASAGDDADRATVRTGARPRRAAVFAVGRVTTSCVDDRRRRAGTRLRSGRCRVLPPPPTRCHHRWPRCPRCNGRRRPRRYGGLNQGQTRGAVGRPRWARTSSVVCTSPNRATCTRWRRCQHARAGPPIASDM